MKNKKEFYTAFCICAAALVLSVSSGCKGVDYIKFANTIPGEYNLANVSKIAVINFNSMPNDPVVGVYSVDDATRQIVQDMVASQFFKGKTYKITNLNVEKDIFAKNGAAAELAQRFDAVMYGRVWWKCSKEYKNIYPSVYSLEKWRNERYMSGKTNQGQPLYSMAHLTETMTDVKIDHKYRTFNATLMLSVTIYRLSSDGQIEKIVEDFAVADQHFFLANGIFATVYVPHDEEKMSRFEKNGIQSENKDSKKKKAAKENAGFIDHDQNANTIPTELQTKIMLSKKITNSLGKKMTNMEVPVEAEFFGKYMFFAPIEENLLNTIIAGKFEVAGRKIVTEIRKAVGYTIADHIGSLSAYDKEKVPVAKNPECIENLKKEQQDLAKEKNADKKADILENIADLKEEIEETVEDAVDDFENEIYALAICEEACGKYDYALENYRTLLKYSADKKYALGISRCLISLKMADRLSDIAKEAKKATKKSSLK